MHERLLPRAAARNKKAYLQLVELSEIGVRTVFFLLASLEDIGIELPDRLQIVRVHLDPTFSSNLRLGREMAT